METEGGRIVLDGVACRDQMSRPSAHTYSERLGQLTDDQLQAALERFGLGELLNAESVPIGLFGQNVFLTSTTGAYVLRGSPHSAEQFPKERFFVNLIHERTEVPVPWPYLIDPTTDIFGWSYVIMPRLPGLQVGDPEVRERLSANDRLALAGAMGQSLARLHALNWPQCGEYEFETQTIKAIETGFAEWCSFRIQHWLDRCRAASGATTDADVAWVKKLLAEASEALNVSFQPAFVHQDYKEGNVVAQRTAEGFQVTGLFDVGGGYFGDGEEDLARSVASYAREDVALARRFLEGYQTDRPLRRGFKERFPVYMLADRLIIWEYGQRNNVWFEEGLSFQDWAGYFVTLQPF